MARTVIKSVSLGSNARDDLNAMFTELYSNLGIVGVTASAAELNILDNCTATTAEVNAACDQSTRVMTAGTGFAGTGTIYKVGVLDTGTVKETKILLDLTGTASIATDLDIIGTHVSDPAHIGRITAALNGTILAGTMKCLEVPVGGAVDVDLYSATEGTGAKDTGIASLAETALVTAGGNWTLNLEKALGAVPAANEYLYLTSGAATAGTYSAGKFLITLYGY
jgi:hypothetical protein